MRQPIDKELKRMSERDRRIAEELAEAGFDGEDLYAALPSPETDKLLKERKENKS